MSGFMSKFKNIFVPEDEYDDDEYEEAEQEEEAPRASHTAHAMPQMSVPKVVSLNNNQSSRMEILNFTMLSYDMTGEICGYIKNRKPIIVNMQKLSPHEMQRAVDYLTGACIALNGTVDKVTDNIFIFAPEHVNINPEKVKQRNGFPPTI